MKALLKVKLRSIFNTIRNSPGRKYFLFALFGVMIFAFLSFVSVKLFGYIYFQDDFPLQLKYFLAEKLMTMVFLTMYTMLILSSLISTLNIFFLSKDLNLLFSSPMRSGRIFLWKGFEVTLNSSMMVIFFASPVISAYLYYFSSGYQNYILAMIHFVIFILSGVITGIMLGFIIPGFISIKKLQPALSVVSIIIISIVVIFLRLLQPEKFGNPDIIDNVFEYIKSLSTPFFKYFPFEWLSKSLVSLSENNHSGFFGFFFATVIFVTILCFLLWLLQKKFYFQLFDKINRGSFGGKRSKWEKGFIKGDYGILFKKEVKSFLRTPEQWSQLLVIGAIIVVFVMNMKVIPLPSGQIKNIIGYMNIGMAAFIVTGLNSRFTFTSMPMENPGISHIFASPFDKMKILKFKFIFYLIPMFIISFGLFFAGEIILKLDEITKVSGVLYLTPVVTLITLMAFHFSLQQKGSKQLSPQHLITSREGISFMLWSLVYIVLSLIFMIRPLYLYFFAKFTRRIIPIGEISLWITAFFLINFLLIYIFSRIMKKKWFEREFF
ncbi:MAG: hypothetical protein KAS21_02705 [Candidatus Aminicenantes bacterium]|nr:hypothetical protein [Candidatus Aminicenantes bacterium]